MKRLIMTTIIVLSVLTAPFPALTAEITSIFDEYLMGKVEEFTLDNGMKFLFLKRPDIPVFSAVILVKAGSVDEPRGKTGVAHVFEHMAFKGTTTVGTKNYKKEKPLLEKIEKLGGKLTRLKRTPGADLKEIESLRIEFDELRSEHQEWMIDNEFDVIYQKNGANYLNAGTSQNQTAYMVSLPQNRLELWARMETDRLMNPVFRQFYNERDVIMEERRMGTDNNPSGHLWEEFAAAAYTAHPYGDPVIGWMDDIQGLTIEDARIFHGKYYVASNIVVAIVGDLLLRDVKQIAESYFGRLPLRPLPDRSIPQEPQQKAERVVRIERDAEPSIMLGWHIPNYPSPDNSTLQVMADILGKGRTSRLYKRLVLQDRLAIQLNVNADTLNLYPGLFTIDVDLYPDVDPQKVIDTIMEEIHGLVTTPPSDFEIAKIKKSLVVDFINSLDANLWLAMQLAYFDYLLGDWQKMGNFMADIENVTSADVVSMVNTYFSDSGRTIGLLQPPKSSVVPTEAGGQ